MIRAFLWHFFGLYAVFICDRIGLYGGDNMEIRVLRYFLTVAREESITRAAEMLHITQPTLSRQISQLEDEVGISLFVRGSRKISLTSEGLLLKRRAEEILQLVDTTERELIEQEGQIEGKISIGCGETESVKLLAALIADFKKKYPKVVFDICTATASDVREQMDRGLLDIGLLLEPINVEKCEYVQLDVKENWVLLMRADSPLAEKEAITPQDMASLPLILPRRANVKNELANWFGEYYDSLNVEFTSNLSTNSAILVDNCPAYAIIIEGSLPYLDNSRLVCRRFEPPLQSTSVLAWKRGQPFSPAVTKFIQHIMLLRHD